MLTVDEVRRLLAVWRETGEVVGGSYFWGVAHVVAPEPVITAMIAAIRELVRSGDITSAGAQTERLTLT